VKRTLSLIAFAVAAAFAVPAGAQQPAGPAGVKNYKSSRLGPRA